MYSGRETDNFGSVRQADCYRGLMMILTIKEGRDILRLDGEDNDPQITALIEAIPPFLYETTGYMKRPRGKYSPVARTAARFILQQWYYGENSDVDKFQRVIYCLLKALSAERDIS
jgi:hypothetical protein